MTASAGAEGEAKPTGGAAAIGLAAEVAADDGGAGPQADAQRRWDAAMVFAAALGVRAAVVAWAATRFPPVADGTFYHTIASRIARGLGYTWLWDDGAVTPAGHYPVGYPALVGAGYALAGAHPVVAMAINALLGALATVGVHRLVERAGGRRAAVLAGALVAIHPGLVAYTPALMTEGVTAALVVCAAWAASEAHARRARSGAGWFSARAADRPRDEAFPRAERGSWWGPLLVGALVGLATLVRPQSLVLAPIFGWLSRRPASAGRSDRAAEPAVASGGVLGGPRVRAALSAGLALVAAIAVCAPWSIRNCVQMKHCALVSYNGGWNLLIGADEAATGTWATIKVPVECREVFDEAEKDVCFGRAARRYIAEHPGTWLGLVPSKLAATFDYAGAGGWYLHAANEAAFPEGAKVALGTVETVFERIVLVLALAAATRGSAVRWLAWRRQRPASFGSGGGRRDGVALVRAAAALVVALAGGVFAFQRHGWVAYAALAVVLLLAGDEATGKRRGAVLPAAAAAVLGSLLVTHAVFFGAGRYSLVAFPWVTALAALAFARRARPEATPEAAPRTRENAR